MVRRVILFWIVLCSVFLFADPLQYLVRTEPSATSLDTHTAGATTWYSSNNGYVYADMNFNFPFNGTTYDHVYINSNGMLSFSSSNIENDNEALPYSDEPQSIYPYWDNLYPATLLDLVRIGNIKYETLGSGDSERFVVTWRNIPDAGLCLLNLCGKFNFQVVLYQNGDIRFRYPGGTLDVTDGSSATIGVQENTTNYDQYSYNSSTIDQTFDILYTRKPLITKTSIVTSDPVNGTTNPKRIPGATIRYCFTVDNISLEDATGVVLTEDFTTTNKDKLTYVKSGKVIQNVSTSCDCAAISDTSGSFSTPTVTISIGTLNGADTSTSRGCAYIEATID